MDNALLVHHRSDTRLYAYLKSCFAPLRRLTFLCLRIAARRDTLGDRPRILWRRQGLLTATRSSAPPTDFALHGESLSLVCPRESNQREGHPDIRVWPAARLPSFRCRSGGRLTRAIHGPLSLSPHPCGSSPCATPPLGLLTGTRAPRCLVVFLGAARIAPGWVPTWSVGTTKKGMQNFQATPNAPFRRPNGIIAEGVERHGCRESRDGPGMALRRWAASGRAPGAMME